MTWNGRPVGNHQTRRLMPYQETAVAAAVSRGVPVAALAAEHHVSTRTIWRTVQRAKRPRYRVEVAGWHTTFTLSDDGVPVQEEPWRPA